MVTEAVVKMKMLQSVKNMAVILIMLLLAWNLFSWRLAGGGGGGRAVSFEQESQIKLKLYA